MGLKLIEFDEIELEGDAFRLGRYLKFMKLSQYKLIRLILWIYFNWIMDFFFFFQVQYRTTVLQSHTRNSE